MVKTLPSNAGGVGSIPRWGAKISHASWPKYQNIIEKRYCNKFNKDFKNGQISYKKRISSPGLMQDTGSLGLVHWNDPEGWYREGGGSGGSGWGTHVHPWWIHVDVWQNQYNIVK